MDQHPYITGHGALQTATAEPRQYTPLVVSGLFVLTAAATIAFCAGAAVMDVIRERISTDPSVRIAIAMACGTCILPLLLLWTPFVSWSPALVRIVVAALLLKRILSFDRAAFRRWRAASRAGWLAALAVLAIAAIWLSIAQVDGAPVPGEIDGVHHLMLTRLIVDRGGLPADLSPFIAGAPLAYHWGAHANAAAVTWLLGVHEPFAVAQVLVWYGAFLRILCVFCMYAATRSITGDRMAALVAAGLTATVSALPAALVAQGRFTHLAGVAVLPAVIATSPLSRHPLRRSLLAALLLCGLFLIHVRVALFAALWLAIAGIATLRKSRRSWRAFGMAAAVALLLVLPWCVRLAHQAEVRAMLRGNAFAQAQNQWTQRYVPAPLLWLTHNGALLSAATAGMSGVAGLGVTASGERFWSIVWWLIVCITAARAVKRRDVRSRNGPWRGAASIAIWVALCAAVLMFAPQKLDVTNVVPYAAGVLTAFVPVILVAGALIGWVLRVAVFRHRLLVAAALLIVCWLTAVQEQASERLRTTVSDDDVQALMWIERNVPAEALFSVMAHPFYGAVIGQDAGYWLAVLTNRRSVLPPLIYAWYLPPDDVQRLNRTLERITLPHATTATLASAGVTHVYIGAATPAAVREAVASSVAGDVVYASGNAVVLRLRR